MHALTHLDRRQHGTLAFPVEYYYVDMQHPRYQMSFHWHNEWEILRVLDGSLQIHIDNEQYCAQAGDILLIRGGVLHHLGRVIELLLCLTGLGQIAANCVDCY